MATPTTMIVPMPNEEKIGLPEKNMPAMAAMTVNPEISTARPEVAAAMSSASAGRAALVLLLHHPAQVEHRVVDADGEADQHRDLTDGLVQRAELADRAEQARGGDEGRDAEQQRDAGGDGRAEREQQDQQRAAHRELHGLRLVGALRGAERLLRRRVAVLLDAQLRMGVLDRGDGRERRFGRLLELLAVRRVSYLPGSVKFTTTERPSLRDGLGAVLRVRAGSRCRGRPRSGRGD